MEIASLKRDIEKVEAGTWVGDIPGMGTMELRVRGTSSKVYTAKLSRLQRAVEAKDRDRSNNILPSVGVRIMGEAAHEVLLLEWRGLTNDGVDFPYDSETAKLWLTDPAYSQFLDAVMWAANVVDNGKAEDKGAAIKN